MSRVVLVQPGATDFDEQGRIKGSLDIPLSPLGAAQVQRTVADLAAYVFDAIYTSPAESAIQTAAALAHGRGMREKRVDNLRNLNQGLWHGKLIEEVRVTQPRVYQHCRHHPESICPPEGESVLAADRRARQTMDRILRRHRQGTVVVVIPEPLATITRCDLQNMALPDFWKRQRDGAEWVVLDLERENGLATAEQWVSNGRAMTGA
jgi:broad specificity phosphatase PhoE